MDYNVELISGIDFYNAFTNNFHQDSIHSVESHEQLHPMYFNEMVDDKFYTFTVYFSKSGYGLKVRWVKGKINTDFRSSIHSQIGKTYYKNEGELRALVTSLFEHLYK
jgi:hypothetical protein